MIALLPDLAAAALTATILLRVICVVYRTTARQHAHPAAFLGFGYSYVILGAGAIVGAVALIADPSLTSLALWLLLAGSCGLILFDRRAAKCWSETRCPLDPPPTVMPRKERP